MKEELRALYKEFVEEAATANGYVDTESLNTFWYWLFTGRLDY